MSCYHAAPAYGYFPVPGNKNIAVFYPVPYNKKEENKLLTVQPYLYIYRAELV